MAALTGILLVDARAGTPEFEVDEKHLVQVDGASSPDAKVFTGARGYLLEIPSEETSFFVDTALMTAFAVREEQVARSDRGRYLTKERFAWSTPVSRDDIVLRFHTGVSEIRLVSAEPKPADGDARRNDSSASEPRTVGAPAPPSAEMIATPAVPVTTVQVAVGSVSSCGDPTDGAPPAALPGAVARECLSLENRPAAGVPGCTRFVFITNRCEVPVLAQVQRIEHLMTGPLPQAFNVTVRKVEWLGCAWWSGAMAPAEHEILAAAFLEAHPRRADGGRPPAH